MQAIRILGESAMTRWISEPVGPILQTAEGRSVAQLLIALSRTDQIQVRRLGRWREGISQFDMLAVFEAITNAVAHRDYSMAGSKVRLRLFENRLELYVPGPLVNTMTPESLPHRQASRNEAITSLLARCPVRRNDIKGHRTHNHGQAWRRSTYYPV